MDAKPLFDAAQKLVNDVDNGLVKDEDMERIEQQLIIILAAIQDKTLRRELILTMDYDDEKLSHGRSR